ncbi:hypothetical protein BEWA_036930 [Theileria equi strain WA]|uniref:Uncharacterized protein n=1 Tax=Theileria equi strain WA TaxID=1537102 RepID=L1LDZ2_THEEQ|nr:hypothetical protein BEWA_036930 [Theileria equi strain WA]EKX73657.1 hypothetical protein BEWA_036930 [Theileria equi strain WA]|eukprot:XP_004833109.1 hypothetical protein BEWA_036930 [Theileria equi strain WA]
MEKTCTSYINAEYLHYSDVNIAKIVDDLQTFAGYEDSCGNTVIVKREDNQPTDGYKRYLHIVQGYICDVKYNKDVLHGLEDVKSANYTMADVHYWEHDYGNLLPLLIGLTTDQKSYTYYSKYNYLSNAEPWVEDCSSLYTSENFGKLPIISKALDDIVLLNLSITADSYGVNGQPSSPVNPDVKIEVAGPNLYRIYNEYRHAPKGLMSLLSTVHNETNIPFANIQHYNKVSSASVYYWSEDRDHENPLILVSTSRDDISYYYAYNNNRWEYVEHKSEVKHFNGDLDRQNCVYNKAHRVDISLSSEYSCMSCNRQKINVKEDVIEIETGKFTRFKHFIKDDEKLSVAYFTFNFGDIQQGLPSLRDVEHVFVYKYPKDGEILLVEVPYEGYSKWYKKSLDKENEWEVEADLDDNSKAEQILKVLKGPNADISAPEEGDKNKIIQTRTNFHADDHPKRHIDFVTPAIVAALTLIAVCFESYNYVYNQKRSCIHSLARML